MLDRIERQGEKSSVSTWNPLPEASSISSGRVRSSGLRRHWAATAASGDAAHPLRDSLRILRRHGSSATGNLHDPCHSTASRLDRSRAVGRPTSHFGSPRHGWSAHRLDPHDTRSLVQRSRNPYPASRWRLGARHAPIPNRAQPTLPRPSAKWPPESQRGLASAVEPFGSSNQRRPRFPPPGARFGP